MNICQVLSVPRGQQLSPIENCDLRGTDNEKKIPVTINEDCWVYYPSKIFKKYYM